MGESTLLVRHLPSSLSKEEKEDLLKHFGAIRVNVMACKGPLKHAAFAEFPNKESATQVLGKLHQTELLGCRLVVEFAKAEPTHQLSDDGDKTKKAEGEEEESEKKEENDIEENTFDFSFVQWGLKYPRRRRLFYLYPPPSPSILTNISHALAACPRLYVQVLHLMNKMDLPAPFSSVTPQPPLAPDTQVLENYSDLLQTEEMDMSSTEESELESDPDTSKPKAQEMPRKRKAAGKGSMKQMRKRTRLAMSMFQQQPKVLQQDSAPPRPSAPSVLLAEVFEQATEAGAVKKIQLKLPGTVVHPAAAAALASRENEKVGDVCVGNKEAVLPAQSPPPPLPVPPSEPSDEAVEASSSVKETTTEVPQSTGFGLITPADRVTEDSEEQEEEESWSETKFISRSELRKGRISHREMDELNIFKQYKEGDPSRRLYIKNLARQVTEEDLHWVFGRYVKWDDELQKNMFDIRLMKEGRMKGQAFVTLGTDEKAAKAVKDTNGFVLKGKPMVVSFARSAKQQEESKS